MTTLGSGTNEIKPFATGSGANVESPASWAGDGVRGQGFQAGTASSQKVNTAFRQALHISTTLAQFMADFSGQPTHDNGDVTEAETNLIAALKAAVAFPDNALVHFALDGGAANHISLTSINPVLSSSSWPSSGLFFFVPAADSSGATDVALAGVTGTKSLKMRDGSDPGAGAIKGGILTAIEYDGALCRVLFSAALPSIPYGVAGGTSNAITTTLDHALASWAQLKIFLVKITASNTTPTTLSPNTLPARNMVRNDGSSALLAGDLIPGGVALCLNDGTNVQLLAMLPAFGLTAPNANGQCRLGVASSSTINLSPFNGDRVMVNGKIVAVGSGVSAGLTSVPINGTSGSLAVNTAYYVSLALISNTPTLRYWTCASYSHVPDTAPGNVGIEVISNGGSPVSTDTLVGMVYIDSSGQFRDTDGARFLLSWFNRRSKKSVTTFTLDRSTTSNTLTELHPEIRNYFIAWSDELVHAEMFGSVWNSSGSYNSTGVALVSDLGIESSCPAPPFYTAGAPCPFWASVDSRNFTEGAPHYVTLFGVVQGNTGTWSSTDDYTYAGGGGYRSKVYINLTVKG